MIKCTYCGEYIDVSNLTLHDCLYGESFFGGVTMAKQESTWVDVVPVNDGGSPSIDNVNHPPHYKNHPSGVECIQITEHMNFCLGNAIKYLWRSEHKNGLEDLKKARWYIDREIRKREKEENKNE